VAAAGIVLLVTALRWLFQPYSKAKVKDLRLPGGDAGSISVDLGEVADAAARAGQKSRSDSAKGRALIDRGTRTIHLTVTAHSPTTLSALTESDRLSERRSPGMLERFHHRHPDVDPHRQEASPRPCRINGARTLLVHNGFTEGHLRWLS
jgi:hypothetical protein